MKWINFLLTLATLLTCNQVKTIESERVTFKKPVVIQKPLDDTVRYISADFMLGVNPQFIGKSGFADTLMLGLDKVLGNSNRKYFYDFKDHFSFVDERLIGTTDTTRTDGLELVPDYTSTIARDYYGDTLACYPVYLVNQTPTTKAVLQKGDHLFGIQEAMDTNGIWRPIEHRAFEYCGNGYIALKLLPQEYIIMAFPKYQGNYKTKLRVRVKNGETIYVSQPFEGTIDKRQFYLEKGLYLRTRIKEGKASETLYQFYGAYPADAN